MTSRNFTIAVSPKVPPTGGRFPIADRPKRAERRRPKGGRVRSRPDRGPSLPPPGSGRRRGPGHGSAQRPHLSRAVLPDQPGGSGPGCGTSGIAHVAKTERGLCDPPDGQARGRRRALPAGSKPRNNANPATETAKWEGLARRSEVWQRRNRTDARPLPRTPSSASLKN